MMRKLLPFTFNLTKAWLEKDIPGQQTVYLDGEPAVFINMNHPRWNELQQHFVEVAQPQATQTADDVRDLLIVCKSLSHVFRKWHMSSITADEWFSQASAIIARYGQQQRLAEVKKVLELVLSKSGYMGNSGLIPVAAIRALSPESIVGETK